MGFRGWNWSRNRGFNSTHSSQAEVKQDMSEWQVLWCQTCLDCFRLGSSMLHYRLGRSTPRDLFMTYSWIYEFIEGRQRLRLEKGVCAQSALYFIKKAPKWAAMRLKKADSPILKLQFTRKTIQRVCRAPGLWGGAEGDTGLSSPGKVEVHETLKHTWWDQKNFKH